MPRKAQQTQTEALPQVAHDVVAQDMAALDTVAVAVRAQDAGLEVGKIAGRVESMLFLRSVAERVIAESFLQLKEGKKYKDILITGADGNLRPVADLPEACEHLFGKSYRTCAEIVQNYELLGAELYDKALLLGLQTKDYRAIRALPEDDQTLIEQTLAAAKSSEEVVALIDDLAQRHAKKLAESEKALADARADLDATRSRLDKAKQKTDLAEQRLERVERGTLPIDERVAPVLDDLITAAKEADAALLNMEVIFTAVDTIAQEAFAAGADVDQATVASLIQQQRDHLWRMGSKIGQLQALYVQNLEGLIAGLEDHLPRTDEKPASKSKGKRG